MNKISFHTPIKIEDYKDVEGPSKEAWEWCTNDMDGDVHIFEERILHEHVKYDGKIKIALLGEVPTVYAYAKQFDPNNTWVNPYDWIKDNYQHFDYVMSPFLSVKDIVGENKFQWACIQCSHIRRSDWGMYKKEKNLSIVASSKQWLDGHKMRHKVIQRYSQYMDIYGNGYNTIIDDFDKMGKILALAPYCFTIIIPNTNIDDWFSDQVTDAMCLGTIPVYCGSKCIDKFFNPDGVIHFNSVEELGEIIPNLTKELYDSKMDAILDNLEKCKHYENVEDYFYYFKKDWLENLKK